MANYIGEQTYDGLISGLAPTPVIMPGKIRKLGTAATLKRGTVLAKSSGTAGDGKLVILGTTAETNETLTAYCILADDVAVGTSTDVEAAVYMAGCFNPDKIAVDTGYTITEGDKDALRNGGIYLIATVD